jgi:hypothetical protein
VVPGPIKAVFGWVLKKCDPQVQSPSRFFDSDGIREAANVELSTNATCAGSDDIRQTRDRHSRQTHIINL